MTVYGYRIRLPRSRVERSGIRDVLRDEIRHVLPLVIDSAERAAMRGRGAELRVVVTIEPLAEVVESDSRGGG